MTLYMLSNFNLDLKDVKISRKIYLQMIQETGV